MDGDELERVDEILVYWFGALEAPDFVDLSKSKLWWVGGDAVDQEVRERFGGLVERARAGGLDHWAENARGCLALVILLDQFTRNLGRGTPSAFAGDAAALARCLGTIEAGLDRDLHLIERAFLYMPMMHAEDREMARRSMDTFAALSTEIAAADRDGHPDFQSHAVSHAEIVLRFGRYPHRNELLGREPTAEELEFLESGGPTFGQAKK